MVVKTNGNEDGVNRLWWHRVQVAMHFCHSNCTNFIVTQGLRCGEALRVGPHHERLPERRMRTPIPLVNTCYVVHVERSAFGLPVPMSSLPKQAGRCNIDPCMTVS